MTTAQDPPFAPASASYVDLVDHALTTTRGVRARLDFDRDVDDQVLLDCIDVAEQAPTGGNNGSRRWMIIRDQATKDRMAELYLSAGVEWVIKKAEELEGTGHQNEKLMLGAKHLGENIARTPALVIPTIIGRHDGSGRPGLFDSVIQSAWSFMVALRARGLGTVWTTMFLNEADNVAELLQLPDDVTQIALFPVAHTIGADFKPTSRRYPAREITYFDRYGRTLADSRSEPRSIADGPGVMVEVDVKASPRVVWDLVTDLNVPAEFSDEYVGGSWDAPDEAPGVGSTFTGRNKRDGAEWTTTSHVVEWDAPKAFAWHVEDVDDSAGRWRFAIEKVPGGSRLRFHGRIGPGRSGLSDMIDRAVDGGASESEARELESVVIGRRQEMFRTNMLATVEGVKAMAEAATGKRDHSGFPSLSDD